MSDLFSDIEKSTSTKGTQEESLGLKLSKPEEMWDVADPAKQILIVEDNKYSAYALMSLLEQHALGVHLAMNGKEAADLVKLRNEKLGETYKLIITDLYSSECDGFEGVKMIKEYVNSQSNLRTMPYICLLSCNDSESCKKKALELGID